MGGTIGVESTPRQRQHVHVQRRHAPAGTPRRAARRRRPARSPGARRRRRSDRARSTGGTACAIGRSASPKRVRERPRSPRFAKQSRGGEPFDIVLMDWKMPGQNGVEVAQAIRADAGDERPPIVIMVSAFGRAEVFEAAQARRDRGRSSSSRSIRRCCSKRCSRSSLRHVAPREAAPVEAPASQTAGRARARRRGQRHQPADRRASARATRHHRRVRRQRPRSGRCGARWITGASTR